MRTKALLCAAAMLVASFVTAQAQVYSVNVAGYVTLSLTNGQNLIANPLDVDGNFTNNTLYTVFGTNVPNLSVAAAWYAPLQTYSNATWTTSTHKWSGPTNAVNAALQPGKGVFFKIAASAGIITTNMTMVGNVEQGALTNSFPVAQQVLSSQVPQGGGLVSALGYAPGNLDKVAQWNVAAQKYFNANNYLTSSGKWGLGEPNISVGESFFITTHATSKWQRNFTVQ